jgi:hypothetical protein
MSHRARSRRPTLGAQLLFKEPEFERPQRSEERRRHRRIEHRPNMAQVSLLAHQRGDGSRPDRYLSNLILAHMPFRDGPMTYAEAYAEYFGRPLEMRGTVRNQSP